MLDAFVHLREAVYLGVDHTGAGSGHVWARPEHPDRRVLKGILVAVGITAAEMLRRIAPPNDAIQVPVAGPC